MLVKKTVHFKKNRAGLEDLRLRTRFVKSSLAVAFKLRLKTVVCSVCVQMAVDMWFPCFRIGKENACAQEAASSLGFAVCKCQSRCGMAEEVNFLTENCPLTFLVPVFVALNNFIGNQGCCFDFF